MKTQESETFAKKKKIYINTLMINTIVIILVNTEVRHIAYVV